MSTDTRQDQSDWGTTVISPRSSMIGPSHFVRAVATVRSRLVSSRALVGAARSTLRGR